MQNFQDTFEKRKRSFISAFSIFSVALKNSTLKSTLKNALKKVL